MGRYNKYRTKQCTHTSWWLVLGWVTTKEYHLCIRFRNDTLHVNIELHLHLSVLRRVYRPDDINVLYPNVSRSLAAPPFRLGLESRTGWRVGTSLTVFNSITKCTFHRKPSFEQISNSWHNKFERFKHWIKLAQKEATH